MKVGGKTVLEGIGRNLLEKIAWGVVANVHRTAHKNAPRWHLVAEATGLGSTRAKELCEAAGFDPDAQIRSVYSIRDV